MAIQIASLTAGGAAAAAYELPQEKRPPLPGEANAVPEKNGASLPGRAAPADLAQTAAELEHISLAFNRRLKFVLDRESREIIVKVIDNETDKVIKVLPPEELQRLHGRIRETIGFLFDHKV